MESTLELQAIPWKAIRGKELQVRIHENRSTMLSVRWETRCVKVSMHRMFLDAPKDVQEALQFYFQRRSRRIPPIVRAYIEENVGKKEYVKRLPTHKLDVQGDYYNLQEIYHYINQTYFAGKIDLAVTWFGKRESRHRSSLTFGLYKESLQLVKIHRKLDDPDVPFHVLAFIMYHEMLHHICPTKVEKNGATVIHTPDFKRREKEFAEYAFATDWIRHNKQRFFVGRLGNTAGR